MLAPSPQGPPGYWFRTAARPRRAGPPAVLDHYVNSVNFIAQFNILGNGTDNKGVTTCLRAEKEGPLLFITASNSQDGAERSWPDFDTRSPAGPAWQQVQWNQYKIGYHTASLDHVATNAPPQVDQHAARPGQQESDVQDSLEPPNVPIWYQPNRLCLQCLTFPTSLILLWLYIFQKGGHQPVLKIKDLLEG
jgi:hypothetical protein